MKALQSTRPYLRGVPAGLPFLWDRSTIERGLNFTLVTSVGEIGLLDEIPGGGGFHDLLEDAMEITVFDTKCLCLSLRQLIRAKRAAGRPKDLEVIAELEAIEDEASQFPLSLCRNRRA